MKLKRYKTFVLSTYSQGNLVIDPEWELKLFRKLVYNPENKVVLDELKNNEGAKSYQVIKDDKLMIAIVLFFNTDQKINLNKIDFLSLFKEIYYHTSLVNSYKDSKFGKDLTDKKYDRSMNYPYVKNPDKNFFKTLDLSDETFIWHYFNDNINSEAEEKFVDIMLNLYNITIDKPEINWKEENLIWLKVQIETQEFIITEQGHLTVVDGIAYGSMQTIINWRNILPRNSWKLISDEPIPVRTTTRVVQIESVYDPEYMRNYYHVRKVDKYKMKIKIQSEATKLGMSYGEYRRQYYPNFTFRDDDKVKFSVIRTPQQYQQQSIEPKVEDLLIAYLTVPI